MATIRNRPTADFEARTARQRKQFLKDNRGLLASVRDVLRGKGVEVSLSTISRTWHGDFRSPNKHVLDELDKQYQRLARAAEAA